MAFGGILIGVLMGVIASVTGLFLGASMLSAILLYSGIGVAALLAVMTAVALRTEDQESGDMMPLGTEAVASH